MLLKLSTLLLLILLISCNHQANKDELRYTPNNIFTNNQNQSIPNLNGVYLLGGHESSWYLTIKKMEKSYIGELFEIEGMLPPASYLLLNQKEFAGQKFQFSQLNPITLTFHSELGPGKILIEGDTKQIIFNEKKSPSNEQLTLSYNEAYQVLLK